MADESELISNCCGASMFGEPDNNGSDQVFGRCADCMEMAEFTEGDL